MPLPATISRDLLRHTLPELEPRAKALPLGLEEINEVLPEGGLPRGGVVEIASPRGLARATSIALSACAAAQAEAKLRGGEGTQGAWCAWIDATSTLYAPAVAAAGVDLDRLLVVRPPLESLARVAVRMATSRAFVLLVVDTVGVPGARGAAGLSRGAPEARGRAAGRYERSRGSDAGEGADLGRWLNVVRKLAVAVEGSDAAVLLLTDRLAARPMPLPVAMRIEVDRLDEGRLSVRVAKDRRGRITAPSAVPLRTTGGPLTDASTSAAWPRSA
ncbi:recombinase A [Chondromyces apiculatus]|uniref:Putative recA protein n=1 Tax=Chondromyces apiculatus DSM 436 TaxID=1192034 RepID=A0A017SYC0_9BACT|nr:recombinase A [Chondromyces apiculatus]EYF01772.1 putative recA protein [Chondromyces apiculatus DSM 436]